MKSSIIPSIIATSQVELDKRLAILKPLKPTYIHLDVMDGQFVKHTSLEFDVELPRSTKYEAHLMIQDPHAWLLHNNKYVQSVLVHLESRVHMHDFIKSAHVLKKKVGIVLSPETDVEEITQYLHFIDKVLVMTVHPGTYGAKFIQAMVQKIRHLRATNTRIDIQVDGGMRPDTIMRCKEAGANQFVVGSFLQNARNPRAAWKQVQHALR